METNKYTEEQKQTAAVAYLKTMTSKEVRKFNFKRKDTYYIQCYTWIQSVHNVPVLIDQDGHMSLHSGGMRHISEFIK